MPFDNQIYFLGALCSRGHEFETSGQSLRYKSSNGCVECLKLTRKDYKETHREELILKDKEYRERPEVKLKTQQYYEENKINILKKVKIRSEKPEIKKATKEYKQKYYNISENKEKKKAQDKDYREKKQQIQREKREQFTQTSQFLEHLHNIDKSLFYLDSLCPSKHNYNNTGRSLRYIKSKACVICSKKAANTFAKDPKNKEKIKKWGNDWSNKQYNNNSIYRLNNLISNGIKKSLKNGKEGNSWKNLVDFNLLELQEYLKKNKPELWELFCNKKGAIHIDHIIPKTWFQYISFKDKEFELCWSLDNLTLLPKKENLEKHSSYIKFPSNEKMFFSEFEELLELVPIHILCKTIWKKYKNKEIKNLIV